MARDNIIDLNSFLFLITFILKLEGNHTIIEIFHPSKKQKKVKNIFYMIFCSVSSVFSDLSFVELI
jgi:hypothetical protein